MSKKGMGKFVLGATVGAALGLLFAPKKGEDTRTDVKKALDDMLAKVKNIAKNHDNVCICAQKVVSLRKISNIKTKKQ